MKIDPSLRGKTQVVEPPARFECSQSGMSGWSVKIPGERPLATPAVSHGRVFVGGGFGSYEFYALDADTGDVIWQYQTTDDGPTAAVIEQQFVIFNTESCELEVLTIDGQSVWKRWLGDPLMSMPAASDGRVFMAYPDSRDDEQHYLACFDLPTGNRIWKQPIRGEIITAPVLAEDYVYAATLDGTLYCLRQHDGAPQWEDAVQATSSPAVRQGKCYYSQREERTGATGEEETEQLEHCAARTATGAVSDSKPFSSTSRKADYLHYAKRMKRSPRYAAHGTADAAVGFGFSKGSAKIHMAEENLGQAHVSGVWSYQGSKPFVSGDYLYASLGDTVQAVRLSNEETVWRHCLRDQDEGTELLDAYVTPPCLVNDKLIVGTTSGDLYGLDAASGDTVWRAHLPHAVTFQPAVENGKVYVATEGGVLYCLNTGDDADVGWQMWGATAAHNGPESRLRSA